MLHRVASKGGGESEFMAEVTDTPSLPRAGRWRRFFRIGEHRTQDPLGNEYIIQQNRTVSKAVDYTLQDEDFMVRVDASGGVKTMTLPTAVGRDGKLFIIKKTDTSANAVTVDGDAAETIDGATTFDLTALNDALAIVSDGTNWVRFLVIPIDRVRSVAADTTATDFDFTILVDATGALRTVNLPTAVGRNGKQYAVKKTDASANAVRIDPAGAETIDGAATRDITGQNDALIFVSDGAAWQIIGSH